MSKRARRPRQRRSSTSVRETASSTPVEVALTSESMPAPDAVQGASGSSSARVHIVVAAVLIVLCAALFGPTLGYPLVFDDDTYLVNNPVFALESFRYPLEFEEFIQRPGKLGSDPDFAINFVMRPVAYASFYMNYLFDGYNPPGYRVVNIAIHAGVSMLIYGLILVLLRASPNRDRLENSSITFIAASSAILFAVHPMAIESVTYIVQRFTSMAALFSLLALWLHFLAVQAHPRTFARWAMRSGSVVSMLLAMQTKECSFTIPVMAVILDRIVITTPWRAALRRSVPLLLCMPLIPALVLMSSAALHQNGIDFTAGMNIVNSRDEPIPQLHYLATQITVVLHYLRLLVWPVGLNLDPEWPLYKSLIAAPVVMSFAILAGLVIAAGYAFKRSLGDPRAALAWAFTLWYFVTISVSSSLIPLPDMVAEHRAYLPSIGAFVVIACLADWLRKLRMPATVQRFALPATALLVVGGLTWKTHSRNDCWSNKESLWRDTAAKSPGKFRVWGNLGAAVSNAGNDHEAVRFFKKAIELEPRFQNGLLNLSNSYLRLNQPESALETCRQLIELNGDGPLKLPIAYATGVSLYGVGRYDEACQVLTAIVEANPNDPMVHRALAFVYVATDQPRSALDHLKTYTRLVPDASDVAPMISELEVMVHGGSGS